MADEKLVLTEEALDVLCGAIKSSVENNGEIIDDENIASDKTYSSVKIQEELDYMNAAFLDGKIDKDKIVTILDDTVTDDEIASAKAVYDGLENINDFSVQVVKEKLDLNDITETGIYFFPQAYTPVNIPVGVNGWLLVMKGSSSDIVKQVWYRLGTANSNSYNTFERYKGNNTWSEWTKFLTEKEYYNALDYGNPIIPQDANLNDYLTPGVYTCMSSTIASTLVNCPHIHSNFKLIVNKNRGNNDAFYGYQMIVGTVGGNPVTDVCVYYRGISMYDNVCVFSKWKIMSGSTVADVNETSIEIDKTALGLNILNNRSLYKVINGICYATIELNVDAPSEYIAYGYKKINTTSLPKIGFATKALLNVETNNSITVVLDKSSTDIKLHGNVLAKEGTYIIQGSFSYPVAE